MPSGHSPSIHLTITADGTTMYRRTTTPYGRLGHQSGCLWVAGQRILIESHLVRSHATRYLLPAGEIIGGESCKRGNMVPIGMCTQGDLLGLHRRLQSHSVLLTYRTPMPTKGSVGISQGQDGDAETSEAETTTTCRKL